MSRAEYYEMEQSDIFQAACFIPKERKSLYLKKTIPSKVFEK